MIIKIWLILFLIVCSITDLVERQVYTMFCFANGLTIGLMHFFMKDIEFSDCLFGMLLGIVCLFVCIVSKESMGKGDALIIGIIGISLGFGKTLEILTWTFLIIAIIAIIGIRRKRLRLKTKVPFVPFVLLGTIITIVIRGG